MNHHLNYIHFFFKFMDPPADPMRIPQGHIFLTWMCTYPWVWTRNFRPKVFGRVGVFWNGNHQEPFYWEKNLPFPKHTYKWPTVLQTRLKSLSKFTITSLVTKNVSLPPMLEQTRITLLWRQRPLAVSSLTSPDWIVVKDI